MVPPWFHQLTVGGTRIAIKLEFHPKLPCSGTLVEPIIHNKIINLALWFHRSSSSTTFLYPYRNWWAENQNL